VDAEITPSRRMWTLKSRRVGACRLGEGDLGRVQVRDHVRRT
jgi:hypothetical protein